MPEFKIETDALDKMRETRFRLLSWGTVLLLMTAAVILFFLGVSGDLGAKTNLRFLFALTVLGAVVGACILAFREALHRAEREMVFVLEESGISRRRKGWPDVRIAFPEIDTVRDERGCLIVTSFEPERKIVVPRAVKGLQVIRAELAKHRPLSACAELPLKSTALLMVSVLSWVTVLWFRDARIVIPAGAVALITLALGTRRLWVLLQRRPKRPLLWVSLGFIWLMALAAVLVRITQP